MGQPVTQLRLPVNMDVPPGLELPPYSDDSFPASAAYKPRLPMDLWPDIVSQLPFAGLEHATLVCQYFRKLAQPLLFQTLVVRPFAFNPKTKKALPQPNDYQKWVAAKLTFYSTPRIAASVKACDIGPQDLFDDRSISEGASEDPGRAIIDNVFEMLAQFQGLTDLSVTMVLFTDNNFGHLSRLINCSSLTLMDCRSSAAVPSRLAVKNLVFGGYRYNEVIDRGLHSLLSSTINPNQIESFILVGRRAPASLLHLPHNVVFPKLHTLCLDYAIICSPLLQPFISKCTALEEIHFPSSPAGVFTSQPLAPPDLPSLKVYHGPDYCARNFTAGRPVRHVRLWGYDSMNDSRYPDDLIPYLKGLHSSSELESLEFSVKCVTNNLLGEICYSFPHLKALRIVVDSMEYRNYGVYTREVLMDSLSSLHLPCGIEYLSIAKFYPWDHEDTPVKDFFQMKKYLAVYPDLRYVSFSGDDFSWRFDAVSGMILGASKTIDDWRGSYLTSEMITKACRSH